jgi:hypothetical protein
MPSFSSPMPPKRLKQEIDAAFQNGLMQSAIIQHWCGYSEISGLSPQASDALRSALIVGSDAEWFEHDQNYITELGLTVTDPRSVGDRTNPWDILHSSVYQHVRIKDNAHLVNADFCQGCPDKFQFGETRFAGFTETTHILVDSLIKWDNNMPRPVILLWHSIGNDIKMIKDHLAFDIEEPGVVVATVDTQVLAVEVGLVQSHKKAKLQDLLALFNIKEQHLHNAGNDSTCTLVAAMLMQFVDIGFGEANYSLLKTCVRDRALRNSKDKIAPTKFCNGKDNIPALIFCTKCESMEHFAADCHVKVHCDYCAGRPSRPGAAATHKTEKCILKVKDAAQAARAALAREQWSSLPKYPYPCAHCIESTDPQRHQLDFAYGHQETDCQFRVSRA